MAGSTSARDCSGGGRARHLAPKSLLNSHDFCRICGLNRVMRRSRAPPMQRFSFSRETSMKKLLTLGAAAAISLALAGTAAADVKIGVGGPFTGGSAAFG